MVIFIKTIGIIIRSIEKDNHKYIGVKEELFKVFYKYKVNVIGIPINNDFEKTKEIVDMCDGIVLSGGDTFLEQDFLLVDYLHKKNIPTLGICLGMQSMGRYFSDFEEVDIKNHLSDKEYVHDIIIDKNSLLYQILGRDKISVNSRHKSAIINTKLNVVAKSEDGVIEGIEDPKKTFFLGLEWHPESLNDINSQKIFDYFVNII